MRKYETEEFQGKIDDHPFNTEYWLENIKCVIDKMSCSLEDYLRCAVPLLKDEAYSWLLTLIVVVSIDSIR